MPGKEGFEVYECNAEICAVEDLFSAVPHHFPPLPGKTKGEGWKGSWALDMWGFCLRGQGLPRGMGGWCGRDANLRSHCERAEMDWRHDQS